MRMPRRTRELLAGALVAAGALSCQAGPQPAQTLPVSLGTPCADHAACKDAELCGPSAKPSHCRAALPQTYAIVIQLAKDFAPYDDDAMPWDADGLPDPYATLEQEGKNRAASIICQTPVQQNTDKPVWNKPCVLDLSAGDKISFAVWDEDGATDQRMMMATLTADELVEVVRTGHGEGEAKATSRLLFSVALP